MKNLVFTSAGDNTNFDNIWLDKKRNYDVWVVYYGNNEETYERYKSKVDYIEKRQGSKFQNFEHIYKTKDLSQYERFFIVDDDIIMSTKDINTLFIMSERFGFWICGPSFDTKSRISHRITKHCPGNLFRYTNYIEVNTPLFTKKALSNLMKMYDTSLIGWGIDHLYIWANGWDKSDRYAIIDAVQCTNPKESTKKGGKRELAKIKDWKKREKFWIDFERKHNIPKIRRKYYKVVRTEEDKTEYGKKDANFRIEKIKIPITPEKPKKDYEEPLEFQDTQLAKIAFMFLTIEDLNQPSLIYNFLKDGSDRCTMYAHSKNIKNIDQEFLLQAQVPDNVDTEWGKVGLVKATLSLLREALKDETNKYFVLLSESCVPLYSFHNIYEKIMSLNGKSWVQKIVTNKTKTQIKHNTLKEPELLGMKKLKDFHLCSQWMLLSRKHAEIAVANDYTDTVFREGHIPDECYFINVLKHHDPFYHQNVLDSLQMTYRKMTHQHPLTFATFDYNILVHMLTTSKGLSLFGRKIGNIEGLTYNDLKKGLYTFKPKVDKSKKKFKKIKTRYGYRFV